jgi:hypothetical protein
MQKDTGQVCRIFAGIILAILAIACVYQLHQLDVIRSEDPYWMYDSHSDHPDKMITLVIGGLALLCAVLLFLVGELLDQVLTLREKIDGPPEENPNDNIWICSECGRANADYITICNCGRNRPADVHMRCTKEQKKTAAPGKEKQTGEITAAGGWKCSCGRTNQSYISTCACGKAKLEVEL